METKYQTSFIPKKPMVAEESVHSSRVSLLLLVSIIIFLISIGLAGYVFLEKNILINKIVEYQKTINANKGGLISDERTIENLVDLNSRTIVAKDLLSKHVAISSIFSFLQGTTLKSVRFKNFNFSSAGKNESGENRVSIQMSGQARDWETVALQADIFGNQDIKQIITEPKISNLALNADGSVSFVFSALVTPSYLSYVDKTSN